MTFRSPLPKIRLTSYFSRPFDNAVATARTCYSAKGIVTAEQVGGDHLDTPEKRERAKQRRNELAKSIYQAGHHTTLQHAHFQFALENVSRQFIWAFLHSHPFYNSEQVSQRYVEVAPGSFLVPELPADAADIYERTLHQQMADYRELIDRLEPLVREKYIDRFPARDKPSLEKQAASDVQKRCQEVARYVLPVATFAYLYHTISGLTLLRYHRLAHDVDCPAETRLVVRAMMDEVLRIDPDFAAVVEDPLPLDETPEAKLFSQFCEHRATEGRSAFARHFDAQLDGGASKLIAATPNGEAIVADAVREVLGLLPHELADEAAIRAVLDPSANRLLSESLNLSLHSKIMRAGLHAHYTFRKKLSHTADSQDQRHRLTPASRPALIAQITDEPDYIVPKLITDAQAVGGEMARAAELFHSSMARSWEAFRHLRRVGVSLDDAAYLLPNAQAVRFTESGDLLALRHKFQMRLCFNAQEEIFRASLDEAQQIRAVHPLIGRFLLPPCTLRSLGVARPMCPEGGRFCGEKVWKYDPNEYAELRGSL